MPAATCPSRSGRDRAARRSGLGRAGPEHCIAAAVAGRPHRHERGGAGATIPPSTFFFMNDGARSRFASVRLTPSHLRLAGPPLARACACNVLGTCDRHAALHLVGARRPARNLRPAPDRREQPQARRDLRGKGVRQGSVKGAPLHCMRLIGQSLRRPARLELEASAGGRGRTGPPQGGRAHPWTEHPWRAAVPILDAVKPAPGVPATAARRRGTVPAPPPPPPRSPPCAPPRRAQTPRTPPLGTRACC